MYTQTTFIPLEYPWKWDFFLSFYMFHLYISFKFLWSSSHFFFFFLVSRFYNSLISIIIIVIISIIIITIKQKVLLINSESPIKWYSRAYSLMISGDLLVYLWVVLLNLVE